MNQQSALMAPVQPSEITIYEFMGHAVRMVIADDCIWFIQADLHKILGLGKLSKAAKSSLEDAAFLVPIQTSRGIQVLAAQTPDTLADVVGTDVIDAFLIWVDEVVLASFVWTDGGMEETAEEAPMSAEDIDCLFISNWEQQAEILDLQEENTALKAQNSRLSDDYTALVACYGTLATKHCVLAQF